MPADCLKLNKKTFLSHIYWVPRYTGNVYLFLVSAGCPKKGDKGGEWAEEKKNY